MSQPLHILPHIHIHLLFLDQSKGVCQGRVDIIYHLASDNESIFVASTIKAGCCRTDVRPGKEDQGALFVAFVLCNELGGGSQHVTLSR